MLEIYLDVFGQKVQINVDDFFSPLGAFGNQVLEGLAGGYTYLFVNVDSGSGE